MIRRPSLTPSIPLLLAVAACTPHNADLTEGTYMAFLATSTSTSLVKETVKVDKYQDHWEIDCRTFEDASNGEESALRLPDSILSQKDCKSELVEAGDSVWSGGETLQEGWLDDDGYEIVTEPLDPWRGEALVTTEGDLQIGFHQGLPGSDDFRFLFTFDPDFQPTKCVTDPQGNSTAEPYDDADWKAEWSKTVEEVLAAHPDDPAYDLLREFPGGTVYFVNSFSYQINPDDPQTFDNPYWTLPDEWGAATGNGKFGQEYFANRTIRYGEPILYANAEATDDQTDPVSTPENVWYCQQDPGSSPSDPCLNASSGFEWKTREEMIARAQAVVDETAEEYQVLADAMGIGEFPFAPPILEDNLWRPDDGHAPGLDGWAELNYNWIVVDKDSDMTKGGHVTGAFQFVMDGITSTSRFFLKGKFNVDRIKGDIWSNEDLQAVKAEEAAENGTPLCE